MGAALLSWWVIRAVLYPSMFNVVEGFVGAGMISYNVAKYTRGTLADATGLIVRCSRSGVESGGTDRRPGA